MAVLGPHGVTNERMDEVADYYRFRPQEGELWPTREAEAYAEVEGGRIARIVVTEGGSGYSSPPTAMVKGFEGEKFEVRLRFSKTLEENGEVESVEKADRDL